MSVPNSSKRRAAGEISLEFVRSLGERTRDPGHPSVVNDTAYWTLMVFPPRCTDDDDRQRIVYGIGWQHINAPPLTT